MLELPMSTEYSRDRRKHVGYVFLYNLVEEQITKLHNEMWENK